MPPRASLQANVDFLDRVQWHLWTAYANSGLQSTPLASNPIREHRRGARWI